MAEVRISDMSGERETASVVEGQKGQAAVPGGSNLKLSDEKEVRSSMCDSPNQTADVCSGK